MRKAFLAVLAVLCLAQVLSAQAPIVTSAYKLAWDNINEAGVVTGSNVYLTRTIAEIPGPTNLVATVPGDGGGGSETNPAVIEWPIDTAPGRWFAWVSFTFVDVDGNPAETPTSTALEFVVIGGPTNPRIVPPQ